MISDFQFFFFLRHSSPDTHVVSKATCYSFAKRKKYLGKTRQAGISAQHLLADQSRTCQLSNVHPSLTGNGTECSRRGFNVKGYC